MLTELLLIQLLKAEPLTVTPDNRSKSIIFIIKDEENGNKITSTLNINVYDSRYGYLDIRQGYSIIFCYKRY